MKKIFVTGGTVFVSKNVAEYFAEKGYEVYILNRDNYEQPKNTMKKSTFVQSKNTLNLSSCTSNC